MKTNKEKLIAIIQNQIDIAYDEFKDNKAQALEWALELINIYIQDEKTLNNN